MIAGSATTSRPTPRTPRRPGEPDDRAGDISGWTPPVPNQGIPGRKARAKAEKSGKEGTEREKAGR